MNPFELAETTSGPRQLDPRVKLAAFIVLSFTAIFWEDPIYLASQLGVLLLLYRWAGVSRSRVMAILVPGLPILVFVFLVNFFIYRPAGEANFLGHLIPRIGGFGPWGAIYAESLIRSVSIVLRFVILLLTATLFIMTTTPVELALGLGRLGIPSEFGLAMSIAVAYIPILFAQVSSVLEAQQSRAWSPSSRNPFKKVAAYVPILVPTFFRSMVVAEDLAAALLSRGFGYDMRKRTSLRELVFRRQDWLALGVIGVFACFAAYTGLQRMAGGDLIYRLLGL